MLKGSPVGLVPDRVLPCIMVTNWLPCTGCGAAAAGAAMAKIDSARRMALGFTVRLATIFDESQSGARRRILQQGFAGIRNHCAVGLRNVSEMPPRSVPPP